jgi:outer membrane protein OmpA-like peptidoglycan-associated protein
MLYSNFGKYATLAVLLLALVCLIGACATTGTTSTRTTNRDKTYKGAAIGAGAGAVMGVLTGEGEADEILARAAIGAGIGAGVGAYMDHQEEKLARIPGTTVERVGDDMLLIHFDSDILFAVDSASLSGSSLASLDQVSSVLNEYPKTAVVVQGHTDSTGSEQHNQDLSERRAKSVQNYLIGRGLDASRTVALGYGEGMPRATNDTEEGRSLNRRVNILLKAKAR